MHRPTSTFQRKTTKGRAWARYSKGGLIIVLNLVVIGVLSQPVTAMAPVTVTNETVPTVDSSGNSAEPNGGVLDNNVAGTSDFQARYESLSQALLTSRPQLDTQLEGWGGSLPQTSFGDLSGGFTLDTSQFDNLASFTSEFFSQGGADGKVAAAASAYAAQRATLMAPSLDLGSLAMGELSIPEEGLLFGLVFDQSLTGILGDTSVLDSVQANDLGSDQVRSSWQDAMSIASGRVDTNLADLLVSSCYGSFLANLGGGQAANERYGFSSNCNPCAASGLYMNSEMNRLLDPTYDAQYFDTQDSVLTASEYVQVPNWLKDPISAYDPEKARQLEGVRPRTLVGSDLRDCNTSAIAGTAALGGVLDNLDIASLLKTSPGR